MRILWFSNHFFTNEKISGTGTWLVAMAEGLVQSGEIELFNITKGITKKTKQVNCNEIKQWLVPNSKLRHNGLPRKSIITDIQKIVNEISPDIIHIWGTETYWGLLTSRGYLKGNTILEIQGLKFAIQNYFYSGLTLKDITKCFGVKEFLKPSVSLVGQKKAYKKWGEFEKEMLLNHNIISTQSNWVRAYVKTINSSANILEMPIMVRQEFVETTKWDINNCNQYQIFTSAPSTLSYKGLHILINAVAILKKKYPTVKLVIAGPIAHGITQGGYSSLIKKKIKCLGIFENVEWSGSLDAEGIVSQMHKANVVVVPSFIESYCLALDEALIVGTPTVASFSGAMPELAEHKKSALYFPPGDAVMCAKEIETFFEDKLLSTKISLRAYKEKKLQTKIDIVKEQLSKYMEILDIR